MLIKICGITSVEDARTAIAAGADMLGVILVPGTPRFVASATARGIVDEVGAKVPVVAVFRGVGAEVIEAAHEEIGFAYAQLHDEDKGIEIRMMQRARQASPLRVIDKPKGLEDQGWLMRTVDRLAKDGHTEPFLIAGGINANNVADVVSRLSLLPQFEGIDVCSGVEQSPGKKNPAKISELIRKAREACANVCAR